MLKEVMTRLLLSSFIWQEYSAFMSKALIPELLPLQQYERSDQQSQPQLPVTIDDISNFTGRDMSRVFQYHDPNRKRSIVDACCRVSLLKYPTGIDRIDYDFMKITSAEYLGLSFEDPIDDDSEDI